MTLDDASKEAWQEMLDAAERQVALANDIQARGVAALRLLNDGEPDLDGTILEGAALAVEKGSRMEASARARILALRLLVAELPQDVEGRQ